MPEEFPLLGAILAQRGEIEEEIGRFYAKYPQLASGSTGLHAVNFRNGLRGLFSSLPETAVEELRQQPSAALAVEQVPVPAASAPVASDSEVVNLLKSLQDRLEDLGDRFADDEIRDRALDLICDELGEWLDASLNFELTGFRRRQRDNSQTPAWMIRNARAVLERFERVKEVFLPNRANHLQSKATSLQSLVDQAEARLQADERPEPSRPVYSTTTPLPQEPEHQPPSAPLVAPEAASEPAPSARTPRGSAKKGKDAASEAGATEDGVRPRGSTRRPRAGQEPPPVPSLADAQSAAGDELEDPALTLGARAHTRDGNGHNKRGKGSAPASPTVSDDQTDSGEPPAESEHPMTSAFARFGSMPSLGDR